MAKVIVPDKYFNAVYNNIYVECADRDEILDYIKWGWQNHRRAKDVAETVMDELYFG